MNNLFFLCNYVLYPCLLFTLKDYDIRMSAHWAAYRACDMAQQRANFYNKWNILADILKFTPVKMYENINSFNAEVGFKIEEFEIDIDEWLLIIIV